MWCGGLYWEGKVKKMEWGIVLKEMGESEWSQKEK